MINTIKRRRNKKAVTAGAVLLAVMLAASACGNSNTTAKDGNEQQPTINEGPKVDNLPDQSGVIEPDVPTSGNTDSGNNNTDTETNKPGVSEPDPSAPVKSGEGTFVGLSDSHSIEIETKDGAMPLQVTDELLAVVSELPSDAKVTFKYTEKEIEAGSDVKQNWLEEIEQSK